MAPGSDMHGWFRRRLPAYVGGLLSELEERRFVEHRAQCEDCRRAFDEFTASDEIVLTERGVHIPAPMLARWARAQRALTGVERSMVRAHLDRCEECRADLQSLGQTAELEFIPALEAAPGESPGTAPPGDDLASGAARVAEPVREAAARVHRGPGRRWVPWLVGGWATAATATLLVVVLAPGGPRPPALESRPTAGAAMIGSRPAPTPRYVLDVLATAGALQGTLRGPDQETTTIRIGPEARFVHLTLPEAFLPDTTTLDLRILGPDASTLLEIRRRNEDFFHHRTLLFGSPDTALVPGSYRVIVSAPFAGDPDVGAYRFRLVR